MLAEDAYDTRGDLWRVLSLQHLSRPAERRVPGRWLDNEIREPNQFDAHAKIADFQPDALRRLGGTL